MRVLSVRPQRYTQDTFPGRDQAVGIAMLLVRYMGLGLSHEARALRMTLALHHV